ncbi:MAG: glycosyltransferase family 2 protein [Saprospiraceae bacterium]
MNAPTQPSLTVIILTYNEELHLERCIRSVQPVAERIVIVDSYSTDRTLEIARTISVDVFQNQWVNYAEQFQWGIENTNITTEWTMRIDADEYLLPELQTEIREKLSDIPPDVTGLYINRRLYFMDKWIKRGYYPMPLLRIWRTGTGRIEKKWMDEHIKLIHGTTVLLNNDLVDHNLNNLTWWTDKHNSYATREAVDRLNKKHHFLGEAYDTDYVSGRTAKHYKSFYMSLPLFLRPFLYFFYRYFLRLGFLEGMPGLIWHVLQGFWYQFLVDAKIFQIKHLAKKHGKSVRQVLNENFNLKL